MSASGMYHVNVFVNRLYPAILGNPAGVLLCEGRFPASRHMGRLAVENGYPETAFVRKLKGKPHYDIRYFTRSGQEVAFCGHATLAAAWVLFGEGAAGMLEFHPAESGRVLVSTPHPGALMLHSWVKLDMEDVGYHQRQAISHLGLPKSDCMKLNGVVFVNAERERIVRAFKPDPDALEEAGLGRLAIYARNDSPSGRPESYILRYFAPENGIPEDHATGSVALALAGWRLKAGNTCTIHQVSPRGGHLVIRRSVDDRMVSVEGECTTSNGPIAYP